MDIQKPGILSLRDELQSSSSENFSRANNHLITGAGEVGEALAEVLSQNPLNKVILLDRYDREIFDAGVLHVAFPWSLGFAYELKEWDKIYHPDLTIVHSTVKVGTCDSLGVVHSPINGKHPYLTSGIKIFPKYFGGKRAVEASQIFKDCGCAVKCYKTASITEAMKIWSTTQYGLMIMIQKEIKEWCDKNNLPFDIIYREANQDYNRAYGRMGELGYTFPVLEDIPGPIGGHCVVPNLEFVKESYLVHILKSLNCLWTTEHTNKYYSSLKKEKKVRDNK